MRAAFVLTILAVAIAVGIIAAALDSRSATRALVIGIVPAIWAVSHVVERLRGRELWHFTAPYPYRWMRDEGETPTAQPRLLWESPNEPPDTNNRSRFPQAA